MLTNYKRFVQLWKLKLPLKVKIVVWLVLRRRVLTADLLLKKGWSGAGRCVLCLGPIETADHFFVGCVFFSSLLASLIPNITTLGSPSGVQSLWESSARKSETLQTRELSSVATIWWSVWLERNRRCFEDKKRGLWSILDDIRGLFVLWAANCQ